MAMLPGEIFDGLAAYKKESLAYKEGWDRIFGKKKKAKKKVLYV